MTTDDLSRLSSLDFLCGRVSPRYQPIILQCSILPRVGIRSDRCFIMGFRPPQIGAIGSGGYDGEAGRR